MKKSSLLSLSALLALSVFLFTACPGDGGEETKTFTVTFDAGTGVTAPAPITVEEGKTITLPTAPTKPSYVFGGWFTAVNGGGTEFTAATKVTASITVHALWVQGGVATITAGTAGADAVKATYTLTIGTALVTGETLTLTNVATADVVYSYATTATTKELQAAAIATAISTAAGAKFDTTVSGATITLTAKTVGAILPTNAPTASVTTTAAPTGAATVAANNTPGVAGVKAVYTISITTALSTDGEKITFANVASAAVEYPYAAAAGTPALQATAAATAINNASGALYDANASANDGSIVLTAKTAGAITAAPTATISGSGATAGVVSAVTETTAGVTPVKAVHTLTIDTALIANEKITLTNVATADFVYPYAAAAITAEAQAAAIKTALEGAAGIKYDISVSNAVITLTAKEAGVIAPSAVPTKTVTRNPTGTATVAPGTAGSDGAKAVYTLTVTTPLVTGETLTLTNVATANVTYTPAATGADTAALQAAAIETALDAAAGVKFDTSVTGATITLTAKTVGAIATANVPTVVPPAN